MLKGVEILVETEIQKYKQIINQAINFNKQIINDKEKPLLKKLRI